ncbi:hypothetical protein L9F63_001452, partial [Diploptera punctata]
LFKHIFLTQKSIHAVIIVKLPDKMSDLEDFDHVFDVFVYDENNGSGFIVENSG